MKNEQTKTATDQIWPRRIRMEDHVYHVAVNVGDIAESKSMKEALNSKYSKNGKK